MMYLSSNFNWSIQSNGQSTVAYKVYQESVNKVSQVAQSIWSWISSYIWGFEGTTTAADPNDLVANPLGFTKQIISQIHKKAKGLSPSSDKPSAMKNLHVGIISKVKNPISQALHLARLAGSERALFFTMMVMQQRDYVRGSKNRNLELAKSITTSIAGHAVYKGIAQTMGREDWRVRVVVAIAVNYPTLREKITSYEPVRKMNERIEMGISTLEMRARDILTPHMEKMVWYGANLTQLIPELEVKTLKVDTLGKAFLCGIQEEVTDQAALLARNAVHAVGQKLSMRVVRGLEGLVMDYLFLLPAMPFPRAQLALDASMLVVDGLNENNITGVGIRTMGVYALWSTGSPAKAISLMMFSRLAVFCGKLFYKGLKSYGNKNEEVKITKKKSLEDEKTESDLGYVVTNDSTTLWETPQPEQEVKIAKKKSPEDEKTEFDLGMESLSRKQPPRVSNFYKGLAPAPFKNVQQYPNPFFKPDFSKKLPFNPRASEPSFFKLKPSSGKFFKTSIK